MKALGFRGLIPLLASFAILAFCAGCTQPHFGSGLYRDTPPEAKLASLTDASGAPVRVYPSVPIPEPVYPADFVRAALNGEVTVRIHVNAQGRVVAAEVVKGSHRELENSVLVAIERWRFAGELPATGQPDLILDCLFTFKAW